MAEQRMRIYRGRVMHRVKARGEGRNLQYESLCTKPHPVLGKKSPQVRAQGYASEWTTENLLAYPDCKHCPPESPEEGNNR